MQATEHMTAVIASRTRKGVGERSGTSCDTSKRSETYALESCLVPLTPVSRTSRARGWRRKTLPCVTILSLPFSSSALFGRP
eukprot:230120-Pyramimonas_sp.AAC.1